MDSRLGGLLRLAEGRAQQPTQTSMNQTKKGAGAPRRLEGNRSPQILRAGVKGVFPASSRVARDFLKVR